MKRRTASLAIVTAVTLLAGSDLLACGDKYLVAGRGTRYQRPKNARAASVLIFADPSSSLTSGLKSGSVARVESALKKEGHRSTTVATLEQLSAILSGGRFDVLLAAGEAVEAVQRLLAGAPDSPVVVALCSKESAEKPSCAVKAPAKESALLEAVDKAVEQRDENARKSQLRG
jgi:hypothetical protein